MDTSEAIDIIDQDRRWFLDTAAMGIAAAAAASLFPHRWAAAAPAGDAIRPFRVNVPKQQLVDLRRRIAATRWPDKETVTDRSLSAAGDMGAARLSQPDLLPRGR